MLKGKEHRIFFSPKTNINLNEIKVEKWVFKLGTFMKSKQTMDLKQCHYWWITTLWKWPWRTPDVLYTVEREGEKRRKAPKRRQHWALPQPSHPVLMSQNQLHLVMKPNLRITHAWKFSLAWIRKISRCAGLKQSKERPQSLRVAFCHSLQSAVLWRAPTASSCAEVAATNLWQNQGTAKLCLGDANEYYWWLSHLQAQCLERIMAVSQEGPEQGWRQVWVPLGTFLHLNHSRTSSASPAATRPAHSSALPPEPDKLPNSCSISRLQTL